MSSVRSITWLPPTICSQIAEEVDRLFSRWAAAWGLAAPGPAQANLVAAGVADAQDFVDLLIDLPLQWQQSLAQALFKFDVHGSPLVDAVVQRATSPLQQDLREAFGNPLTPDNEQGSVGHRGVLVIIEVLGQRCGFMLSCARLRASGRLKPSIPESLPNLDFEAVLAGTPVPLVAELGRADINLDELMQLSPGDVLLLKENLDAPLRVVSPGSSLELSGHLGAFSDPPQRAMRWLAS